MGRNRFAPATVDRIPLDDGDWIEVKHELNNGEHKKLEAAGLKPPTVVNGKVISPIDWEVYEIERCAIFLVDWSFRDADDRPVPVNLASIRALDIETFDAINSAIFKHVAEVAVEKKAQREERERVRAATAAALAKTNENSSKTFDDANSDQTSSS